MDRGSRRWMALVFIALAQLMVALDATVMSVALPTAQASLHATNGDRQWVVTAYTLAFGGLLLLGGRLADALGHRRAFLLGLGGFTVASAVGGAAPAFGVLIAARAVQGAFAALLAPTALSLLAITFTESHVRARAFAVYGAVAGSGGAIGMVLGGLLTQYLTWRWCLYVNVPVAIVAAAGGYVLVAPSDRRAPARFDLLGAAIGTGGLAALVLACSRVATEGWASVSADSLLVASVVVLAGFVAWEKRTSSPLLPLEIVLERNRAGAYLGAGFGIAGMLGGFLFLTYFLQVGLGFSPLWAGVAFLPIAVASQAGSWLIAARLMPRVAPRMLMVPGALVAAAGMAVLTQVPSYGGYLLVLVAEVLLGLGISCLMVPAFSLGTHGVDRRQAGVAAAAVNASGQVGGSLGVAILNAAGAGWGAGLLVAAAVLAGLLVTTGPPPAHAEQPAAAA